MTSQLQEPKPEPRRDRFGRPYVTPPNGGKPVAYTRATTVAGTLDDLYGLMQWRQRQTAVGLADRKDLMLAVAAHRDDKQRLNQICEDAMQASQSSAAATTGTAIHSLTELIDRDQDLPIVDQDTMRSLAAYRDATANLTIINIEQFVVHDELKIAGTLDRIVELPNGNQVIADVKTGSLDYSGPKIAAQLAIYANSVGYNLADNSRYNLPDIDRDQALVIHLPSKQPGVCTLHWVDIQAGWDSIPHAMYARGWRKRRDLIEPADDLNPTSSPPEPVPLEDQLAAATTVDQLEALYRAYEDQWTNQHTELAKSVKQSLTVG